jgi:hypothetical protein
VSEFGPKALVGVVVALVGGAIYLEHRSNKMKVFISFDWDHDRDYRNLLSAFARNPKNDINFEDSTPGAIDTKEVGRVKAVLTTKIREATHTLVLIGQYANTRHHDSTEIGALNWQWWEIDKSKQEHNKLVAVKLAPAYATPAPLLGAGASWASYNVDSIAKALREA